ncbi:MAG: UDP-N-acetylglucosamine 2-epimerase (non-hydrolyzing) [Dictyoglomus sp.]|nr:UDP-N-acetylglucosamine 2-epimerase (non-hydrolyzing) [Dictyoglomus sp.]MCX7941733.1 UDP-N-acetylglucosamine 2-epimerase (non-hydrolyzing) [Dictyoglomaceae bacterium]MDW8189026.1 UDP-N-acetylglucosamine 2-epimerase (non-hydrolyzing) [Dictyoglomus sp.]
MIKISLVFGTRPEAIKMAPVAYALKNSQFFETQIILTAQHRELLDQVMDLFKLTSDYDLNIMEEGQSLTDITIRVLKGLDKIWNKDKPDMILVHGDTTTTFSASLSAFYKKIPIAHVEAGLRTYNKYQPYPEEMNRRLTGILADLHFAPTKTAKENLLKENVPKENIFITGNTVIDAFLYTYKNLGDFKPRNINLLDGKMILVTAHRRENWGEPLKNIALALKEILENFPDVYIVFPMHPNPIIGKAFLPILGDSKRAILTSPVDYRTMVYLIANSYIILSDSGGIQEEAPSLGKPVLVLREVTERPEAVKAGTVKLVGTNKDNIVKELSELLENEESYRKMSSAINPYGDGKASLRIVEILKYYFKLSSSIPEEFKGE